MANKAKQSLAPVMSMAEISKLNQADAVTLFVDKTTTVSRAYMDSAKLIIHLKSTLAKNQTIHGVLGKKGVRTSTINNAMQAVRVWESLVEKKHISEGQFDKLSYAQFVDVNAAVKAKGIEVVAPLVCAGDIDEIEFIAEHKITSEEKKAQTAAQSPAPSATDKKPEKKPAPAKKGEPDKAPETTPDGEKVTHLTEPPKEGVTTLEVAPPKPEEKPIITNIIQMPKKAVTLAEGEAMIDSLQNVFAELSEDDFVKLSGKLVELADTVVEQTATIRSRKAA